MLWLCDVLEILQRIELRFIPSVIAFKVTKDPRLKLHYISGTWSFKLKQRITIQSISCTGAGHESKRLNLARGHELK